MPAAPAAPPADAAKRTGTAPLPLPAEFAAALDADGGLLVKHPDTGDVFRLVEEPAAGPPETTTLLEDVLAAEAEFDDGRTDADAILAAVAAADADPGGGMTLAEVRAEMERRHPELRGRG